jgi:hypothetical protein
MAAEDLKGSFTPNLGINKQGIQRGLNILFPKANFNFAEEDNEEIIDDNEIIKPPMPGKSFDVNLIPDEIQQQLNLLTNTPIVNNKDKTSENVVTSDNVVDDDVDVNDGPDDSEQSLSPTMEGFEEFSGLQQDSFNPKLEGLDKYDQASQELFDKSLDDYENVFKGSIPTIGKVEDYKQEFYEATGLDPSGKPDLRTAATAFGLALMQNKAGKGFNIGRIMSEIGKAGEKALPLAERARQQAKSEEIAAGRFALGEIGKDKAARNAAITNKINATLELKKEMRKQYGERNKAILDHYFNTQIENLKAQKEITKAEIEAGTPDNDLILPTMATPILGIDNIKVQTATRKNDLQRVFVNPSSDVITVAKGYTDTLEAEASLDKIINILNDLGKQSGFGTQVLTKYDEIVTGLFGKNYSIYQDENGEINRDINNIDAIKDRVIAQYKRFLTQETGNGISNEDVNQIKRSLGELTLLSDPNKIAKKVQETKEIFLSRRTALGLTLKDFQDRDMYLTEKEYRKTMEQIDNQLISSLATQGTVSKNITFQPIATSDDGIPLFKIG